MKYFDTHCHLNLSPLKEDFDNIVKTAKEKSFLVNIVGTDLESSILAVEQAKKHDHLYATIGIHPNDTIEIQNKEEVRKKLADLLENKVANKIIAIGETGLDFHYFKPEEIASNFVIQKEWFLWHYELAKKHDLPLMIHIRDAYLEMLELLMNLDHYGIIHCFNQDYELAKKFLNLKNDWVFSIAGPVTFKNATIMHDMVKELDIHKIISETDAPWLTPVPYRGKLNYPYYAYYTIEKIAQLKNIEVDECARILLNNAKRIFKLK